MCKKIAVVSIFTFLFLSLQVHGMNGEWVTWLRAQKCAQKCAQKYQAAIESDKNAITDHEYRCLVQDVKNELDKYSVRAYKKNDNGCCGQVAQLGPVTVKTYTSYRYEHLELNASVQELRLPQNHNWKTLFARMDAVQMISGTPVWLCEHDRKGDRNRIRCFIDDTKGNMTYLSRRVYHGE